MPEKLLAHWKQFSKWNILFSLNFAFNLKSLEIDEQTYAIVRNFRTKLARLANFDAKLRTIASVCLLIFKLVGLSAKLGEKGNKRGKLRDQIIIVYDDASFDPLVRIVKSTIFHCRKKCKDHNWKCTWCDAIWFVYQTAKAQAIENLRAQYCPNFHSIFKQKMRNFRKTFRFLVVVQKYFYVTSFLQQQ